DFAGAQGGGRVGGEEGVAGAGGEQAYPPFLHVPDGAAANVVFADLVDLDGAHHAGVAAFLLQGVGHGQGVDDGGQHAHVVAGHAIHSGGGQAGAAEDVAAADHQADFGAGALGFDDFAGEGLQDFRVDAVV